MRFDHVFIAFGVAAGALLPLIAGVLPAIRALPALLWLLLAILAFDLASAKARGRPLMESVSTLTRALAFAGGVAALMLSGGNWG